MNSKKPPIQVFVADDDAFVRTHLLSTLHHSAGMSCLGAVGSYDELRCSIRALSKSNAVLLLDLDFRGQEKDGAYIAENLLRRNPEIKILLLTVNISERKLLYLLNLGVRGLLLKSDHGNLQKALTNVCSGGRYVSQALSYLLLDVKKTRINVFDSSFDLLSPKERGVLEGIYKGKSSAVIAEALSISLDSVYVYKSRASKKLGVNNDIELAKRLKSYFLDALSTAHPKILDLPKASENFSGNTDAVIDILRLFVEALPDFMLKLQNCLAEKDNAALTTLIHKFYGGLCYVGAPELQAVVMDLLLDLESERYESVVLKVEKVQASVEKLLSHIEIEGVLN